MDLRRLILEFKPEGHEVRVLYRTRTGANPQTKARRREAAELARTGLEQALRALDRGETEDLGTSGYSVREDVLGLPVALADSEKPMKRGA